MMATIKVLEGRDLIAMDPNGLSDPYVLIGLADPVTGRFDRRDSPVRSEVFYLLLFFIAFFFLVF